MVVSQSDLAVVRDRLGREPTAAFEVVVRDATGAPAVVRNDPFTYDGTPMPTRYWLVDPVLVRAVSQLEACGGVRAAQAAVDPEALRRAHEIYTAERDALIDENYAGPRPYGGVGGTRTGVKCLHAHYAWHLAGGSDPVGEWVSEKIEIK